MTDRDIASVTRLLSGLGPFVDLPQASLTTLARQTRWAEVPAGAVLMAANESAWLSFVVEGEALVRSDAREPEPVAAGTPRAREPVFSRFTSDRRLVARTPVRLLRVQQEALKGMGSRGAASTTGMVESALNSEEDDVFAEIYEAYSANRLPVPSLPDIALKIRDAVNSDRVGVAEVAAIIQNDPALSGRLIQVANSPVYRGVTTVSRIRDAVARLGLKATRTLAFGLSVKQLFRLRSILLRKRAQILYDHCAHVSALAFVLAREYDFGLDPETALLGGLVHDIGVIPVLHYADDKPHISRDGRQLEEAVVKLRGLVGVLVLTRWGFDNELIDLVDEAEDWYRADDGPVGYADLIIAAQLYYYSLRPNPMSVPGFDQVALYRKLHIAGDGQAPIDCLGQARQEIDHVRSLLDSEPGVAADA